MQFSVISLFTFIFIGLLGLTGRLSMAQPVIDLPQRYQHAVDLYQQGLYLAARQEFSQTLKEPYQIESAYYVAACAMRGQQEDGESLMQAFVVNNPHHLYAQSAYLDMAEYYFGIGHYDKALKNFRSTSSALTSELIFQKGYCEFELNQYHNALETFKGLEGRISPFQSDAAYFTGYIYYQDGEMLQACDFLKKAFESEKFSTPAMELYVGILYQQKKYRQLIELVTVELTPVTNDVVLNLLAGAQYALQQYESAAKNYKQLLDNYAKHRNEENYFRAGFSYFQIQAHETAEHYLKRSAVADDSVGAYASYYLGVIYAEAQNLPFAITSFENTTKYPTVLREDALYHQATCMIQLPNYQGAIQVLNDYLHAYPKGRYSAVVHEMLGSAYALTNDYDLAMQYIEKLDRLSTQLKQTYQRVSFLKGVSLFNDKKYRPAIEVFQKSLIYDVDATTSQQTYYWVGEALSLLDEPDEALFYYKTIQRKPSQEVFLKALYGKAYAYYNLKNYEAAWGIFQQFETEYTNIINVEYRTDALLRMGDCLFALKNYERGINYYTKADKAGNRNKDYLYYQLGLLNRYLDQDQQAKTYFTRLIQELPQSSRADDAYFQMAQIDYETGNAAAAIEAYRVFLTKYPTSLFVPFALLNQAVAYDNQGETTASIVNYKEILDRFPRHQTANSALLGLQDKNTNGQFETFEAYLQKFKTANPNSEALENIEFESAKAIYYQQKYELAIDRFNGFYNNYPNSALITEAWYLTGDAYFRLDQTEQARIYFKKLENKTDFGKYAKVIYRLATIESQRNDLEVSNRYYHALRGISAAARDVINVQSGLMENHFAASRYDSAIYYGQALQENPKASVQASAVAGLVIGKSEYSLKSYEKALQSLLPLVSNAPDETGAEAYYYISRIYYDQALYERALESLFVLTNHFKQYEKWSTEAYLLMADIYIETNELFQAKATLNSLIANTTLESIREKAQLKLSQIENVVDTHEPQH